ncbi:wound-induced protein 1 [Pyrus x bretschneideri]|uniref:wound-induced protein 1 n=1 Tax=Pyrus x bretschneideri TaxID=225117 RepID=UPI00202EAA96|nr:wound-induced protein 1 [Pyrus x bretschneideri]
MRILTGSQKEPFQFVPQSIASFGPTVLVEGCDRDCSISWVHAWTVANGVITGVREYFNTSLTVTRLGNHTQNNSPAASAKSSPSGFSSKSSSSSSTSAITSFHCPSVWESSVSVGKSVPGLVLAI